MPHTQSTPEDRFSISPEDCISFAEAYDDPIDVGLRIILSHGTCVHLLEYDLDASSPYGDKMLALIHRAYAPGYVFTEADKALIIAHIAPYLREEWERGQQSGYEGSFDWLWPDYLDCSDDDPYDFDDDDPDDMDDPDEAETPAHVSDKAENPVPVLLLQHYEGDHHDADNRIYNWYMDMPFYPTDCSKAAMRYRELDSLNPQIAKILVNAPG